MLAAISQFGWFAIFFGVMAVYNAWRFIAYLRMKNVMMAVFSAVMCLVATTVATGAGLYATGYLTPPEAPEDTSGNSSTAPSEKEPTELILPGNKPTPEEAVPASSGETPLNPA